MLSQPFRSSLFMLAATILCTSSSARERLSFNADWAFQRGDTTNAANFAYDAAAWRRVTLPHDWSIEHATEASEQAAGNGGFFPTGVAWYRKEFATPTNWRDRRVVLELEGAYMNSEVWLNGSKLRSQPYGYTPIHVELSPLLHFDRPNVMAVRVDNSAQPNSRWYSGSGLFRPAWLHVTEPVYFQEESIFVRTTALTDEAAVVAVDVAVGNDLAAAQDVRLTFEVLDAEGLAVANGETLVHVSPHSHASGAVTMKVPAPRTWSPESPYLYRLTARLFRDGSLMDESTTTLGLRTVQVSAESGFLLNGQRLVLNGGNVHHDTGVLGAAAFGRAEERKVELLKAAGFNAVRTAHNPPSRAFLEACDRLGLLVMNEIFDGWAAGKNKHDYSVLFDEWWRHDVEAWVKRDRNHASVVIWSTGNEMFERGNATGQRIAHELAAKIRTLDPTRPVTAGVNGMGKAGKWEQLDPLFAAFDIAGYNYELVNHTDDHVRWPQRVIVAAESYQSEVFANWAASQDHPYVIGDFVWSAIDYLGEAGIGRVYLSDEVPLKHWEGNMWPWHGAYCGDIDLAGWRKPISHYRNIVWDRGEKLYAAVLSPTPDGKPWNPTPWSLPPWLPSWTWPGQEGKSLTVAVYSRHDAVRLELNGQPVGEAPTGRAEEFRAIFEVPYASGELVALGLRDGRVVERFELRTAGPVAALRVAADRTAVAAGGQDLSFITIEAVDATGRPVPTTSLPISVALRGPGVLAGLGTGDLTSSVCYQSPTRSLHQGRALAAIRTTDQPGDIAVEITAPGIPSASLTLKSNRR